MRFALSTVRPKDSNMVQGRQDSFYNGWLYHLFVDPTLRKVRKLVRSQVAKGSSLIDIGCGTGELVFSLVDLCCELVGVETSYRMWSYASQRARAQGLTNLRIVFADGAELINLPTGFFDYATACMVLHEMNVDQRLPLLRKMQRLASTLILVDYRVPPPANLTGIMCRLIERLAGRRHYHNYLSYLRGGGLMTLLEAQQGLVEKEILLYNRCIHLVRVRLCG